MGGRIRAIRARLAAADPRLAYIGGQKGMFSMLPLSPQQVLALREDRGIYMAGSGPVQHRRPFGRRVERFASIGRGDAGWLRRPPVRRSGAAASGPIAPDPDFDWRRDRLSGPGQPRARPAGGERASSPTRKVLYQFSARGHDMAQVMLGTPARPSARRRLRLLPLAALAALARRRRSRTRSARPWAAPAAIRTDAISASSSIIPIRRAARLCRCAAASARNIRRPPAGRRRSDYYQRRARRSTAMTARSRSCSAATRRCATNGFWSALTIATTQKLPMLFYVEDNQYGISVPSTYQTPGGDIATNLASFANLASPRPATAPIRPRRRG